MDAGKSRVLVVDDEPSITDLVSMALRYEGIDVAVAHSGRTALQVAAEFRPHLVVLDVMLPDLDGFEVARRLGLEKSVLPILFLTARGDLDDRLHGFTLGGDDYVTKPFSVEELLMRISAILRRVGGTGSTSEVLTFADVELHLGLHEVHRKNHLVSLTPTEYRLLRYLMVNCDRVVSKTQILDRVWQHPFDGSENVVEIFISSLRRKLEENGPRLIHTVRGFGYRLRAPERSA